MTRVVIVGAGPAGIAAAELLCAGGHRPVLIDEGERAGGQGYRQPSSGLRLDMRRLMGSEADKYQALHARFDAIREKIDYRPRTLVWAIDGNIQHLLCDGRVDVIEAETLLLATGAMDRVAPLPGWTLPGVFTLGGAQVALKDQGCLIGHRVAFLGSSPLMLLAARQYREMGGEVAVVADTTPLRAKAAALPQLLRAPRTLLRGLGYMAGALRAGTPLLHGVTPIAIEGDGHVEGVRLRDPSGRERLFTCDAVAIGHGLKPETQLADLAGASFAYDADFRLFLPKTDGLGRSRPGLYLAGDAAGRTCHPRRSRRRAGPRRRQAAGPQGRSPARLPEGPRSRLRLARCADQGAGGPNHPVPLRKRHDRRGAQRHGAGAWPG